MFVSVGTLLPGRRALYLDTRIRALAPVPYGIELTYSAKVVARSESARSIALRALAFSGDTVFMEADLTVKVRDGDAVGTEDDVTARLANATPARDEDVTPSRTTPATPARDVDVAATAAAQPAIDAESTAITQPLPPAADAPLPAVFDRIRGVAQDINRSLFASLEGGRI